MTSAVVPTQDIQNESKPIDREKKCPLLLRVFLSLNGRHNLLNDYSRNECPTNELQVYTWTDATLKEIAGLVREVNEESRRRGTYFDFALVFPDIRTPAYRMRDIGTTICGQKGPDDSKTLSDCRFQIGDYLDIAIQVPKETYERGPQNRRNDRRDMGRDMPHMGRDMPHMGRDMSHMGRDMPHMGRDMPHMRRDMRDRPY